MAEQKKGLWSKSEQIPFLVNCFSFCFIKEWARITEPVLLGNRIWNNNQIIWFTVVTNNDHSQPDVLGWKNADVSCREKNQAGETMCGKEMAGHAMKELLSTGMLVSRAQRKEDMQNVNCMSESLPAEREKLAWRRIPKENGVDLYWVFDPDRIEWGSVGKSTEYPWEAVSCLLGIGELADDPLTCCDQREMSPLLSLHPGPSVYALLIDIRSVGMPVQGLAQDALHDLTGLLGAVWLAAPRDLPSCIW